MATPPPYGQPHQPYPAYPGYPQDGGEPPLWLPHYRCSPVVAVKRFFRKYVVFSGRASRAEYWWWALAYAVAWLVLIIVGVIAGLPGATQNADGSSEPGPGFIPVGIIMLLVMLGCIVPSIALTVRRLHDADFSGLFYLLVLIPYLGSLVIFILTLMPPKPGGARFDPQPTPYH